MKTAKNMKISKLVRFEESSLSSISISFSSNYRSLILMLFLLLLSSSAFTQKKNQKKPKKKLPTFSVRVEYKNLYDNNILKYSEKYLQRFINLEDEGRFNIDTYDDFIFSPSASISVKHYFKKNKPTELKIYAKHNEYLKNDIKNWDYFSLALEQSYQKRGLIGFNYSYIPDFYIRHFRDDDYVEFMGYVPEAFKPMSFTKENYAIYVEHRYKKTKIKLELNYTRYFYNVHYIEYDSNEPSAELTLSQNLLDNNLRLTGSVSYKISNAKGYDEYGESNNNSDDGDASFKDYNYSMSVRYKLPNLFKHSNNISFYANAGKKNFITTHYVEYDMLHAGRQDFNYRFRFIYKYYLSKHINASLFYNFYGRNTTSASKINAEEVDNEKTYTQYQTGFSLSYSFEPKIRSQKKNNNKKK